jgi:hypothetical protein
MSRSRWRTLTLLAPLFILAVVILLILVTDLTTDSSSATEPLAFGTPFPTRTPGPSPTLGPTFTPTTTPTPEPAPPGAEERDATRRADLEDLRAALEEYRDEHGSYPDTGGNIQTLCVYEEADMGCKLEEFLDPLPVDPLGDPHVDGYWYGSDGESFVLVSQQEEAAPPAEARCEKTPEREEIRYFYCVTGP